MTRLQLRRLALQATRRPELLPVLQDALLESPVYGTRFEHAMGTARGYAARVPHGIFVVAFDTRLHLPHDAIRVVQFDERDFDWARTGSWVRNMGRHSMAPVFIARGSRSKRESLESS